MPDTYRTDNTRSTTTDWPCMVRVVGVTYPGRHVVEVRLVPIADPLAGWMEDVGDA